MQCLLYNIYFWNGFSYILQIDMHLICAPMLTKFYSCKKWVLEVEAIPHGRPATTWQVTTSAKSVELPHIPINPPYGGHQNTHHIFEIPLAKLPFLVQ
jgi:hypothetical protein